MKINPITQEDIAMFRDCLDLNEETGALTWKKKIAKKTVIGAEAGYTRHDGYKNIQLFGVRFLTHRVVFAMVHGCCDGEIDHINGDPSDNKPSNLRVVDRSHQNMNKPIVRPNKHGFPGVYLHKPSGLYSARVRADGKCISLGYFKTAADAHNAYLAGVEKYHGEYRRAA